MIAALLLVATRGGVPTARSSLVIRATARQEASSNAVLGQDVPLASPVVAEKKWALCVGAGEYTKGLAPLKYAAGDARAFAAALETAYGFDPTTVGLLADGADAGATSKAAGTPTSTNVLGELNRLLGDKRLDRGDLFVFYFSGHGVGTAKGDYLMPTDVPESEATARGIPVREVVRRLVGAGLKNVLIVADACRSGGKNEFGRELQDLGRKANIAILLGCAPGQCSYEAPALQHGVFTHFLIRSMTDRRLADPASGALWASAVATKVARQVKSYTQADYPSDPQVPAVWSESTQDVLLAAYPPPVAEGDALSRAGREFGAGALDAWRYARYLSGTGRSLAEEGRQDEAVQAFKTLDGLGRASWRDLGALALSLRARERESEVGSLVARALHEPEPSDYSEYVVLTGDPAYVGADRYLRALRQVARPDPYGFRGAALFVSVARGRLGLGDAEIAQEMRRYLPYLPVDSPAARYVTATIALGEGHSAEALSLAEAARALPGAEEIASDLRMVRYRAATALNDGARIDAIIAEGEIANGDGFDWGIERLRRMSARKDPAPVEAARTLVRTRNTDIALERAMELLGRDAGRLLPEARAFAEAHRFSWRAPVNLWLVEAESRDFERVEPIPDLAFKYTPDPSDLLTRSLYEWEKRLEEAALDGRIDGWRAGEARIELANEYARHWEAVRANPVSVLAFALTLTRGVEPVRGAGFARSFLWPYARRQTYVGSTLRTACLTLALNGGDAGLAREVLARLKHDGELNPNAIVRYAVNRALAGDTKETERAIALWPEMGRGAPPPLVRTYFDGARAVLAARRGDAKTSGTLVDRIRNTTKAAVMLGYLALFEGGGRRKLSGEFVDLVTHPVSDWTDLRVTTLRTLVEGFAANPKRPTLPLAQVSCYLARYPGHPAARAVGFEGKTGLAHYAGTSVWNGSLRDELGNRNVEMRLLVGRDGNAKGKIEVDPAESSPGTFAFTGTVDARGNLSGVLLSIAGGRKGATLGTLLMKLPPTGFDRRGSDLASRSFPAILAGSSPGGLDLELTCVGSAPPPRPTAKSTPKPVGKRVPRPKTAG